MLKILRILDSICKQFAFLVSHSHYYACSCTLVLKNDIPGNNQRYGKKPIKSPVDHKQRIKARSHLVYLRTSNMQGTQWKWEN